jgi:hypothetical protein
MRKYRERTANIGINIAPFGKVPRHGHGADLRQPHHAGGGDHPGIDVLPVQIDGLGVVGEICNPSPNGSDNPVLKQDGASPNLITGDGMNGGVGQKNGMRLRRRRDLIGC